MKTFVEDKLYISFHIFLHKCTVSTFASDTLVCAAVVCVPWRNLAVTRDRPCTRILTDKNKGILDKHENSTICKTARNQMNPRWHRLAFVVATEAEAESESEALEGPPLFNNVRPKGSLNIMSTA